MTSGPRERPPNGLVQVPTGSVIYSIFVLSYMYYILFFSHVFFCCIYGKRWLYPDLTYSRPVSSIWAFGSCAIRPLGGSGLRVPMCAFVEKELVRQKPKKS